MKIVWEYWHSTFYTNWYVTFSADAAQVSNINKNTCPFSSCILFDSPRRQYNIAKGFTKYPQQHHPSFMLQIISTLYVGICCLNSCMPVRQISRTHAYWMPDFIVYGKDTCITRPMMEQFVFPSIKFLISSCGRCSLMMLTCAPRFARVPEDRKACPALRLEAAERLPAATRAFFLGDATIDMNWQWNSLTAARASNLKLCNLNDVRDQTTNYYMLLSISKQITVPNIKNDTQVVFTYPPRNMLGSQTS